MTSKQKRRATKRRRHEFGSISDPAVEQMESFDTVPRALLRRIIVAQPKQPWYKRLVGFARSHDRKAW